MTAWQYFAGAGLVAALCPLHGHVAVAGDGHGRGARVDLCVPGSGRSQPLVTVPSGPPSVRVAVPGIDLPTVRHPGHRPRASAGEPAVRPGEPGPAEPPRAAAAALPAAKAGAGRAEPSPPAPAAGEVAEAAPGAAPAPPAGGAAAAPGTAFAWRPYRSVALERRGPGGMSTVTLMVVVTTPAVLAAAALRPRSKSRG
ncbi:hypothetical protein [Streptomyces sp. NPDC047014]|uniref:hypothetical protein n=1 Tax=Streptomyces sp. NPDC047014 TaxID=3155736 RepID=UPI0033D224AC